ncbi:5749_t:CDS:1, partial [Acaulospora morrowiae]
MSSSNSITPKAFEPNASKQTIITPLRPIILTYHFLHKEQDKKANHTIFV